MSEWISTKVMMPTEFQDVLVWFDDCECNYDIANWDPETASWCLPNNSFKRADVMPPFWRELPAPPK